MSKPSWGDVEINPLLKRVILPLDFSARYQIWGLARKSFDLPNASHISIFWYTSDQKTPVFIDEFGQIYIEYTDEFELKRMLRMIEKTKTFTISQ